MIGYAIRRIIYGCLVVIAVAVLVFLVIRLVPGDAVSVQLQDASGVSAERAADLRAEFGLDQPVHVQLWQWLQDAARGDLGDSFFTGESVTAMYAESIPITLQLGAMAIVIGATLGLAFGIGSAIKQNTPTDNGIRVVAVMGLSIPNFLVGLLLLLVLSLWFQWSPPLVYSGPTEDLTSNLQHMIFPAIALSGSLMAGTTRMTRSSMLETLGSNFIRLVRAKGAPESVTVFKHALRNSIIAVFTFLGMQLGMVLSGTVILETLFSLPGAGSLLYSAVLDRDYPVIVGGTVFYSALYVGVTIAVDLLYRLIDPRIRHG